MRMLGWTFICGGLGPFVFQVAWMQVFVELEPVATHVDPVGSLAVVEEVSCPLENFDILGHVSVLVISHVFVRGP